MRTLSLPRAKNHTMRSTPMIASLLLVMSVMCHKVIAGCNPHSVKVHPDNTYIDNADGTVTDRLTGLMWQKCNLGRSGNNCEIGGTGIYHWEAALLAAKSANADTGTFGYNDWRLPNAKELVSLVERACNAPAINKTIFPNTSITWHWSSTSSSSAGFTSGAWVVSFGYGAEKMTIKYYEYPVRLVRG